MLLDVSTQGITPDDPADKTALLQALIDSAADGTVFYFPHGIYPCTQLDFSRLKSFSIVGDAHGGGGIRDGSSILGTIIANYGGGAGSFQMRDLNLFGGVQATNAVLSNIQDIQGNVRLDNPFMVSIRSAATSSWDNAAPGYGDPSQGGSSGIIINGGMRATVEAQDIDGFYDGIRIWGVNHAIFSSRYEVQEHGGLNLGVDPDDNPAPLINASVSGVEEEANGIGINVVSCQGCSISAIFAYGHVINSGGGSVMLPDNYGLYVGNVQNTTFAGLVAGGYFYVSDIGISQSAANDFFTDVAGSNAWSDGSSSIAPNSTTWQIDPAASGLIFSATNKP
jgi:hypothetical protein